MANQNMNYTIPEELWASIKEETTRLTAILDSGGELQPSDVQKVTSSVRQLESAQDVYSAAAAKAVKLYKSNIAKRLSEIGYQRIDNYISVKKQEQKNLLSKTLTEKLVTFNQLVDECLSETKHLKDSALKEAVPNHLLHLFPKVNSGAKANAISDWAPIKTVISNLLNHVDATYQPIYHQLPISSQTILLYAKVLQTGDLELLKKLPEMNAIDQTYLQNKAVAKQLTTENVVVDMLAKIINDKTDSDTQKLLNVDRLMSIWHNKHIYK